MMCCSLSFCTPRSQRSAPSCLKPPAVSRLPNIPESQSPLPSRLAIAVASDPPMMDSRALHLLCLPSTLLILVSLPFIVGSDPDPLQDFCVGDLQSKFHANGLFCKDPALVESTDFVFTGFRLPGNTSATGFAATLASVLQFPGLNSLGVSLVRADFAPGGVNVPHYHPRATEIAMVSEGIIYSGFVTTDNKVFSQILHKGDVMVIPRGLVHFQLNVGDVPGVIFGAFDSQSPGLNRLPTTLFGSGIKDEVLEKAFHMSAKEVEHLKANLTPAKP